MGIHQDHVSTDLNKTMNTSSAKINFEGNDGNWKSNSHAFRRNHDIRIIIPILFIGSSDYLSDDEQSVTTESALL